MKDDQVHVAAIINNREPREKKLVDFKESTSQTSQHQMKQ